MFCKFIVKINVYQIKLRIYIAIILRKNLTWLCLMKESLCEILIVDSSCATIEKAAQFVGRDIEAFSLVYNMAIHGIYPINMRAARVVQLSVYRNPAFLDKKLEQVVEVIETHTNDGVKRSFLNILIAFVPQKISPDLLGRLITICFDKIISREAVAIKYYAIDILLKIIQQEPDLKQEFLFILHDQIGNNSVSLDRKIQKVISQFKHDESLDVFQRQKEKMQ